MSRQPMYLPLHRIQRAEQRAKRIAQARFVVFCLIAALLLVLLCAQASKAEVLTTSPLCRTGFLVRGAGLRPGCTIEYWQDCDMNYTTGWDKYFRVDCPNHVVFVKLRPTFETRPPKYDLSSGRCWEQAYRRWSCFVDYAVGLRKGTAACPTFPYNGCGKFVVQ